MVQKDRLILIVASIIYSVFKDFSIVFHQIMDQVIFSLNTIKHSIQDFLSNFPSYNTQYLINP